MMFLYRNESAAFKEGYKYAEFMDLNRTLRCPYPEDSEEYKQWQRGATAAINDRLS